MVSVSSGGTPLAAGSGFDSADSDKDGVITMEEYKLFVKHLLEQYESQGAFGGEEEHAGGNNWFDDDELAELDDEDEEEL